MKRTKVDGFGPVPIKKNSVETKRQTETTQKTQTNRVHEEEYVMVATQKKNQKIMRNMTVSKRPHTRIHTHAQTHIQHTHTHTHTHTHHMRKWRRSVQDSFTDRLIDGQLCQTMLQPIVQMRVFIHMCGAPDDDDDEWSEKLVGYTKRRRARTDEKK